MGRLLRQAAVAERDAQRKHDERQGAETPEEAASRGWLYIRVGEFLDRGFAHHVRQDFEAFKKSEEKKLGKNFKLHTTRAVYLERLAGRLKSSDLAPGFVMPEDFSQFDHTTWPAEDVPDLELRWEFFENDPQRCAENILRGTRPSEPRLAKLAEFAPQYSSPGGTTFLPIIRDES